MPLKVGICPQGNVPAGADNEKNYYFFTTLARGRLDVTVIGLEEEHSEEST